MMNRAARLVARRTFATRATVERQRRLRHAMLGTTRMLGGFGAIVLIVGGMWAYNNVFGDTRSLAEGDRARDGGHKYLALQCYKRAANASPQHAATLRRLADAYAALDDRAGELATRVRLARALDRYDAEPRAERIAEWRAVFHLAVAEFDADALLEATSALEALGTTAEATN